MRKSRECHKCETRASFENELDSIREKYGLICSTCKGFAEKSYKGISFIHLGNGEDIDSRILAHAVEPFAQTDAAGEADRPTTGVTSLPVEVEEYLLTLLCIYTQIKPQDHAVIIGLMQGKTLKTIADEMGVTRVMTWKRYHRLCKQWPFIRVLAHGKIGLKAQREKARRDAQAQGTGPTPRQMASRIAESVPT